MSQFDLIEQMRDKGLMAVFMSQIINYQFSLFFVRLKTVHTNICRVNRPEKRRREDDERLPPKRRNGRRVHNRKVDMG